MNKDDIILKESEKAFLVEAGRKERLTIKAEKYIWAVGIVIGFKLIDLSHLSPSENIHDLYYMCFTILAFIALAVSLVLTLYSMQTQNYKAYPRDRKLIDSVKDEKISDSTAKRAFAEMYLSAHNTNASINDKRARVLFFSNILLIIGFVFAVISYLIANVII